MSHLQALHYDINLTILPEGENSGNKFFGGTISVDCTITIQNATNQLVEIFSFLLYRLVIVESIHDDTGRKLTFIEKVVNLQERPQQQVKFISANFYRPITPGEIFQIHIKYHGAICGYPEVFPYVQDHVSLNYTLLRTEVIWHPVVGDPINGIPEKPFSFKVSICVQGNLIALANGQSSKIIKKSGGIIYTWQSAQPQAWGHITIACALFHKIKLAPNISLYYLKEDSIGSKLVAKGIKRTIKRCSDWFGSILIQNLNIAEIPEEYGSEASPNLILQTADAFHVNQINASDAYRRAISLIGHEIIHLWNVPSREEKVTRFLDESITHYFEALLLKEEIGSLTYWRRMEDYRSYFLKGGKRALITPLAQSGYELDVRDEIARGKGPWLLCVLHHLIGDKFLVAIRKFLDDYRVQGATLDDFQNTIVEVADVELGQFFQEWIWSSDSSQYMVKKTPAPALIEEISRIY